MDNFTFSLPTKIHFGRGGAEKVGGLVRDCGGSKVLIVYGSERARKSEVFAQALSSVTAAGCSVTELGGVRPNPRVSLCREGIKLSREKGIDFILAIGGGSVIDTAKCIALGTHYDGDVWDYFVQKQSVFGQVLPLGAIVTLPAAGSENNCGTVINNDDGELKYGLAHESLYPRFAVMDPTVTFSLPPYQTAAGAVDTIAHTLSAYTTGDWDNELLQSQIEAIIRTVIKYAPVALAQPDNYNARAQLMWAAAICCNSSLALGISSDGTSHIIEHEFGAIYDITHGAGLAIIIPAWYKYLAPIFPARFARFAEHVFGVPYDYADPMATATEGIARMEAFFKSLGMPVRLSEVGIDDARFEEIAIKIKGHFGLYGNIKKCDIEDTLAIMRLAL